jgi:hypothetical protein
MYAHAFEESDHNAESDAAQAAAPEDDLFAIRDNRLAFVRNALANCVGRRPCGDLDCIGAIHRLALAGAPRPGA